MIHRCETGHHLINIGHITEHDFNGSIHLSIFLCKSHQRVTKTKKLGLWHVISLIAFIGSPQLTDQMSAGRKTKGRIIFGHVKLRFMIYNKRNRPAKIFPGFLRCAFHAGPILENKGCDSQFIQPLGHRKCLYQTGHAHVGTARTYNGKRSFLFCRKPQQARS